MSISPTLRVERSLLRGGVTRLAAADEVGRGALCGPVTIGMVVISAATRTAPQGVRDSKLLTPDARSRLAPKIRRWADAWAVGHAMPAEIDAFGLTAALRLAGHRALAGLGCEVDQILLDGNHDYLTPQPLLVERSSSGEPRGSSVEPVETLFELAPDRPDEPSDLLAAVPPVLTRIKADLTCAAVAAASILAKTERDAIMADLHDDFPDYRWAENKGYAAPAHIDALTRLGATAHHRRSWSLPGLESAS